MRGQMRRLGIIFALCLLGASCSPMGDASKAAIYTSWQDEVAVGGYDVVSFYSGKPLQGRETFSARYANADWYFSSRANRDLFNTNPMAFVPQYGGYCAWAVAHNKLAKGSPEFWHVRDGQLYLNFNARIQEQWDQDIPGFIKQANSNWPDILEN